MGGCRDTLSSTLLLLQSRSAPSTGSESLLQSALTGLPARPSLAHPGEGRSLYQAPEKAPRASPCAQSKWTGSTYVARTER